MFFGVKVQQPFTALAVVESLRHHHFAIQQALFADLAHQHAEMSIRAIQHGRHTESPGGFPIGFLEGIHASMLPRFPHQAL
jgi:hypothetical protein